MVYFFFIGQMYEDNVPIASIRHTRPCPSTSHGRSSPHVSICSTPIALLCLPPSRPPLLLQNFTAPNHKFRNSKFYYVMLSKLLLLLDLTRPGMGGRKTYSWSDIALGDATWMCRGKIYCQTWSDLRQRDLNSVSLRRASRGENRWGSKVTRTKRYVTCHAIITTLMIWCKYKDQWRRSSLTLCRRRRRKAQHWSALSVALNLVAMRLLPPSHPDNFWDNAARLINILLHKRRASSASEIPPHPCSYFFFILGKIYGECGISTQQQSWICVAIVSPLCL